MLGGFEVSNFKSIKHLDLKLHPFMVLVGPNGAGKTNIVQALELLGAMLEHGSIEPVREMGYDEIIRREKKPARAGLVLGATFQHRPSEVLGHLQHGRERSSTEQEVELAIRLVVQGSVQDGELHLASEELQIRQGPHKISIKLAGEKVNVRIQAEDALVEFARRFFRVRKPEASGQQSFRAIEGATGVEAQFEARLQELRADWHGSWLAIPRLGGPRIWSESAVERLRLDASTLRRDALTKERFRGFIGPAGEGLALAVDRLRGHDKEPSSAFKDLLRKLNEVYPRIEEIEPFRLQPGRLVLRFKERGIDEQLGQANVSDGVLHALALLLALEPRLRHHGVVAIEEPENAIHPWPLRQIIERAQGNRPTPLIITTHSSTVVDAIADPGALFVVEQLGEAGTTVTPARDKEHALDSILRESGKKLGEIWLEGGLGGVPTSE